MDIDFGDVSETTEGDLRKTQSYKDKKNGTVNNKRRQSLPELEKKDIKTINFKKKAQSLGFSSEECQKLVSIYGGLL